MAATQVAEAVVEEVAENLEETAEAVRRINAAAVGYFGFGVGVGAGLGFFYGYRFAKERMRTKAYEEFEEEVAKMREFYAAKLKAAEEKPSVESIIEQRGYSQKAEIPEPERPLKPPVPIVTPPMTFPPAPSEPGWDYATELARRNGEKPYIIHKDEFEGEEHGFSQVTYTYFAEDDVLVGEDERPLPNADIVVGQDNLQFGHGSEDGNVVYVRNVSLQLEMEITRDPRSYEETVLGLDPMRGELEHTDRRSRRQRQRHDRS